MAAVEMEPVQESPVAISQPTTSFQPTTVVHVVVEPPRDFLVLSIFMLVCCFFPLGIFAIYMSLQVQKRVSQGDIASARKASVYALVISIVGITIGVLIYIGVIIFIVIVFLYAKSLGELLRD
ncbi:synapse differentiation-inducing gene protein 1-like [Corticium candelabrum]|uniref:synapse differentiation-inducing gene protein 1-like n=1 Tax=Corticium candelabrum TaxID=121492 RepID=UPI002E25B771|nr:synapse differentiation-inducing gene protein 1-like [Corticium candelabrum]